MIANSDNRQSASAHATADTSAIGNRQFLERLQLRAAVLDSLRAFFTARGYLAVETPIRISAPALELHIDAPPSGNAFLRSSPELYLKRLLELGAERVFELGPCFRAGERGARHLPEFTMLEWYRTHATYTVLMPETEALFVAVWETARTCAAFHPPALDLTAPWPRWTVRDTFLRLAGWDPVGNFDADRFDLDMVRLVEPQLPKNRPIILMDYPVEAAALARCRPGTPGSKGSATPPGAHPVAERWELYLGGMELANAFGELTDPVEQRRRFEACARERAALGKDVYPLDEDFLAALARGLPPCAGIALGVDRLMMLLTGAQAIEDVRAFVA